MYSQPTRCPVCSSDLTITRLYCSHCDTTIEGHFTSGISAFAQLSSEQLQFVLNFIRCEGRFNRMEEEMNMSYPTLRNRLSDVIHSLGFEPGREEPVAKVTPEDRIKILEELEKGQISLAEAQRRLREK